MCSGVHMHDVDQYQFPGRGRVWDINGRLVGCLRFLRDFGMGRDDRVEP